MDITLSADQQTFARLAVATGRLEREEQAVQQALALWEDRERRRAILLATLDEARSSLANGNGTRIDEQSMQQLSSSVKQRGRARLAAELAASA